MNPKLSFTPSLPPSLPPQEITRSAKGLNYMTCLTALDPDWLPPLALHTPLLSFHPPLSSPPPSFDAPRDAVVFYCVPKYGSRNWELRPYPLTGKDLLRSSSSSPSSSSLAPSSLAKKKEEEGKAEAMRENECRWFARLLLEGKVLPEWSCLYRQPTTSTTSSRMHDDDEEEEEEEEEGRVKASSSFSSFLNDPPALITHKRPVRKVFEALQPLIDARVSSLAALRKEWARDASFLKRGIKMWVRPERAAEFEALWKKTVVAVAGK